MDVSQLPTISDFTQEEIRVMHQALNEVCNGIHLEESEFETRLGTDKDTARDIMERLEVLL